VTLHRGALAAPGDGAANGTGPAPAPGPWLARRLFPVLAAAVIVVTGMISTTLGPRLLGKTPWALPDDLWGTLVAASRLAHLHLSGLYTQPTGLVSFPGTAVIMIPAAAAADAAGLSLHVQDAQNPYPAVWLLAGPYQMVLSAVALFAADAIAEGMGVTRPRRLLLTAAGAVGVWNVSVRWGHPEDAVAVGLLMYGILALSRSHAGRSGWLTGAAVAVQPLVLLALPVVVAVIEPRRMPGFLARAAVPGALLLGAALAANPQATFTAVTEQPNSPVINHSTLWTPLSPHLSDGTVAAGPARVLAVLLACACGVAVWRRRAAAREAAGWSPGAFSELLWWAAVALALRCAFEPVMVSYYLWPPVALALIAASPAWPRLIPAAVAAVTLTLVSQLWWHGAWSWWVPMLAGLALALFLARPWPHPAAPAPRMNVGWDRL